MADKKKDEKVEEPDDSSLESPSTEVEESTGTTDDVNVIDTTADSDKSDDDDSSGDKDKDAKPPGPNKEEDEEKNFIQRIGSFIANINPYLILFIVVFLVGVVLILVASFTNQKQDPSNIIFEGQELDQAALDELLSSESNVGTVDQTLTVAANSIFEGKVLIKDSLDIAGAINVGGALSLPGITVAGESNFDEVNVSNNLSILGGVSIQQSLNVQGGANIVGDVAIEGILSATGIRADTVEFTSDLILTRHVDTGGGTPSRSAGTAVGGGGTVSISGNDIAGTITINTGGSPPAGFFVRVNFVSAYSATPHVQITPVGSSTADLNYYVTRDTSGFRIGTTNAPVAATTYVFDYFVNE